MFGARTPGSEAAHSIQRVPEQSLVTDELQVLPHGDAGKPPVHVPTSLFRTDASPQRQAFDVNQTDHVSSFDPKMMEVSVLSALPVPFVSFFQLPLMPPSPSSALL